MPAFHLQQDGATARLLIDHPERRNAFSRAMWRAVPGAVAQALSGNPRVLVLQSSIAGHFASGADISEFESTYADAAEARLANEEIQAAIESVASSPVPTVALIDGPCIGGGVALILACDIRLASERATFAVTPARLGLSYHPADVVRLVRACGRAGAAELLFSGRAWDAARASQSGLVNEVVAVAEFEAAGAALLDVIGSSSLEATKALKRALDAAEHGDSAGLGRARSDFEALFSQPDFQEGRSAFLAKRAARFPSHQREP